MHPLQEAALRVGLVLPVHASKETLQLKSTIEVMRRQIQTRDNKIHSLETDYTFEVQHFKNQITTVRSDLIIAQSNLKREIAARIALEKGFVTEDNYLTSRLSVAQKGVKVNYENYYHICFYHICIIFVSI